LVPVLNFLAQVIDQEQQSQEYTPSICEELATKQQEPQQDTSAQLMNIYLQALGRQSSSGSPTALLTVKGKQAIALIDSGSSTSFIVQSFAIKTGGGMLISGIRSIYLYYCLEQ
jgi:hypothetical protein